MQKRQNLIGRNIRYKKRLNEGMFEICLTTNTAWITYQGY